MSLLVPDADAMEALGRNLRHPENWRGVVWLQGDLGAGKTLFARAFIHALGYEGYVKSPSYGLLETYRAGGLQILHLDLYRIEDPEELEFLAIRDLFDEATVLLVEWPDRGGNLLRQFIDVVQHPVDTETHMTDLAARLDVDIAGPRLDGL